MVSDPPSVDPRIRSGKELKKKNKSKEKFEFDENNARVSFEKSASMRSEKQLSAIIGVLGFLFGFLICSGVLSSVLDFDFGSIDGFGKFSIAVLMGCVVGLLYMPAGKNARSFWLGSDQLQSNLEIFSYGWFAEMLVNKNVDSSKEANAAISLVGNVGLSPEEFAKLRLLCLLLLGVIQIVALRPNLQMYLNEAVLSWYQKLHASKVLDLDFSWAKLPITSSIVPPLSASHRHRSWFHLGFLAQIVCSISNHRRRSHLAVTDPGSCGLSSHLRPPLSLASRRCGFSCANCFLDSLHDAGLHGGVRLQAMGNGEEHPSTLTPCSSNPPSVEFNEDRPNPQKMEDCSSGTRQNVEIDGDDMIEKPKKGMEFNFIEDLLSYYKSYGKKCGFGVMTKRTERGEDQIVRKTECKANINALRCDGKLQLTTVHNIHNHGLSPKKSSFFRCNREVSDAVKRVLDTNDMAGVRMNKSFRSLVVGVGGFENLPFLEKDCRNYIDKARHLRLGAGGAGALREYFLRMQYKNPRFFALMDLNDDGSEEDSSTKCSCGLFQIRGILCKHILVVLRYNEIKFLPDSYILDRWGKDIKKRYTLIHSSYDAGEQHVDSNRYSEMLNICYQMITLAAGLREHTQDVKAKLYGMIDLYHANQEPPTMTQLGSNVG
ncbi:hypothetical protein Q3G72_033344 [Acer saccharum]|nr:hypothetical protein Q3G72_033344 [Acer saccharum]